MMAGQLIEAQTEDLLAIVIAEGRFAVASEDGAPTNEIVVPAGRRRVHFLDVTAAKRGGAQIVVTQIVVPQIVVPQIVVAQAIAVPKGAQATPAARKIVRAAKAVSGKTVSRETVAGETAMGKIVGSTTLLATCNAKSTNSAGRSAGYGTKFLVRIRLAASVAEATAASCVRSGVDRVLEPVDPLVRRHLIAVASQGVPLLALTAHALAALPGWPADGVGTDGTNTNWANAVGPLSDRGLIVVATKSAENEKNDVLKSAVLKSVVANNKVLRRKECAVAAGAVDRSPPKADLVALSDRKDGALSGTVLNRAIPNQAVRTVSKGAMGNCP